MKQQKFQNPSTWHGLKKACQVEGRKTGGCFASQGSARTAWGAAELLCSGFCMQALCRFKGAGLIPLFLVPEGKDNPDPRVGKRTHCFGVTFPFLAKAMVVFLSPGFGLRTLPGKLMQRIPQGFDTGIASMGLGIGAAFIGNRRGASQGLQTGCVRIARPIIPDLCEQTRSQSLARTGQTAEDFVVFMRQKGG